MASVSVILDAAFNAAIIVERFRSVPIVLFAYASPDVAIMCAAPVPAEGVRLIDVAAFFIFVTEFAIRTQENTKTNLFLDHTFSDRMHDA